MQIVTFIIVAIFLGLFGFLYTVYQKSNKILKDINEQFATTDVYFKQRWSLIPTIIEIVKGYAENEKALYEELDSILKIQYTSLNREQKSNVNTRLGEAIAKLIAIVDNYPSLKASVGFIKEEEKLSSIEREIMYGIKDYNKYVDEYNKLISEFPGSLVAEIFKLNKQKQFSLGDNQRANLKLSFK